MMLLAVNPTVLSVIGVVGAALVTGGATWFAVGPGNRRTNSETDKVITDAARSVVTLMIEQQQRTVAELGELRAQFADLKMQLALERVRCDALEQRLNKLIGEATA
jgi:hypothetical protein